MTSVPPSICLSCVHLRGGPGGQFCDAFPTLPGIPDQIKGGFFDHRSTFPGDHDIRFELRPGGQPLLDSYLQILDEREGEVQIETAKSAPRGHFRTGPSRPR